MGGRVVRFSADKYYEAGRVETEKKMGDLFGELLKDGRIDDASKAASDPVFREKMYKEYQIE